MSCDIPFEYNAVENCQFSEIVVRMPVALLPTHRWQNHRRRDSCRCNGRMRRNAKVDVPTITGLINMRMTVWWSDDPWLQFYSQKSKPKKVGKKRLDKYKWWNVRCECVFFLHYNSQAIMLYILWHQSTNGRMEMNSFWFLQIRFEMQISAYNTNRC